MSNKLGVPFIPGVFPGVKDAELIYSPSFSFLSISDLIEPLGESTFSSSNFLYFYF